MISLLLLFNASVFSLLFALEVLLLVADLEHQGVIVVVQEVNLICFEQSFHFLDHLILNFYLIFIFNICIFTLFDRCTTLYLFQIQPWHLGFLW